MFVFYRGVPLTIFEKFTESLENRLEITYFYFISVSFLNFCLADHLGGISVLTGSLLSIGMGVAGILFTLLMLYLIYIFQQGKMLMISDEIDKF